HHRAYLAPGAVGGVRIAGGEGGIARAYPFVHDGERRGHVQVVIHGADEGGGQLHALHVDIRYPGAGDETRDALPGRLSDVETLPGGEFDRGAVVDGAERVTECHGGAVGEDLAHEEGVAEGFAHLLPRHG